MELHYLKLFNTLAVELNFSKAANSLYISQPAVSMQIKKLETDLGFKLFDKIGKNLYLNENGKLLYEYTRRVFSLIEEVESKLYTQNKAVRGTVNIGASNTPGSYILPRILGEFKELYPQVNTNLHIAPTYEVERMILENKLDFAINGGDKPINNHIFVEILTYDEVYLVASPDSSLAKNNSIELSDLYGARYVAHEKSSMLYKLIQDIISELGVPADITMALGNIDAIKQAVSAGLGISAIPKSAVITELKYGLLKQIKLDDKLWLYPYNLIYHKKKHITPSAEKLIELIRTRMKKLA